MSERRSFYRKVFYGTAIAVLLFPIALLSQPATVTKPGGKLAQMRHEFRLGEANLGEVDPASETMKLATLGLRGIAVNLLWEKARYYKMTEDWTNLTATLEQLAKLQPHFVTFWKYQAWNLSYNVSVEFDDYRDRYYYVRRGIDFLKEGERYNVDNPQILSDLGWFVGHKIGRADEHVQYRRLFKADDDFHAAADEARTMKERDNWLVSKDWYSNAIGAVDERGQDLGRTSPRMFYSRPAKSQMNYADAVAEEGYFDDSRRAWILASEEWEEFGQVPLSHTQGGTVRLGNEQKLTDEVEALRNELDGLMSDARAEIAVERRQRLTDEEIKALETPIDFRTDAQHQLVRQANDLMSVTARDVAAKIAEVHPELAKQAYQVALDLQENDILLRRTRQYKMDANYDYWKMRADFEQSDNALAARELMFRARRAFRNDADLLTAKDLYGQGFEKWRLVIDEFPDMLNPQDTTGDDLLELIKQYDQVLDQLDETLDENFPLWDIIEIFDVEGVFREELAAYQQIQEPGDAVEAGAG